MVKKGLGRGLQALIPPKPADFDAPGGGVLLVPLENVVANANQPRKKFDPDKIRELAGSIKEHGVLQPIVVRTLANEKYEIVVGERRWRASELAGLKEIPCIVRDLDQKEITELALIENIQREDLNSLEEAEAYQKLMVDYNYTQEELAARLGKSRPYIANTLRLLNLSLPLQNMVRDGILSAGHARAVLSVTNSVKHPSFVEKIVSGKLSVRQAEEMAKAYNEEETVKNQVNLPNQEKGKNTRRLSPIFRDVEDRIRHVLGTKVKVFPGEKGGRLEIDFYSDDDLTRIMDVILGDEVK